MYRKSSLAALVIAALVSARPLVGAEPASGLSPRSEAALSGTPSGASGADWLATLAEFEEWASVQKIYDAAQINAIRVRMVEKASQLKGPEYYAFLDEVNAKLRVLMSAEAREARKWLGSNLAVASDQYAAKLKAQYPDVVKLTPSQLQDRPDQFDDKLAAGRQTIANQQTNRKFEVEQQFAANRRQEEANAAARAKAATGEGGPNFAGGYNPGGGYRNVRAPAPYRTPLGGLGWGGYGGYRW